MGLDMYLYAKVTLTDFKESEERNKIVRAALDKIGFPPDNAGKGNYGSIEIQTHAGYWRKANHIHKWFVNNVQGGKDECNEFPVTREQLIELRSVCKRVLKDRSTASGLLPTQSGFFFGSTDYDEGYFEDVQHTIDVINKALEAPDYVEFSYQSSW